MKTKGLMIFWFADRGCPLLFLYPATRAIGHVPELDRLRSRRPSFLSVRITRYPSLPVWVHRQRYLQPLSAGVFICKPCDWSKELSRPLSRGTRSCMSALGESQSEPVTGVANNRLIKTHTIRTGWQFSCMTVRTQAQLLWLIRATLWLPRQRPL
jgi:hypothetical protein